MENVDDASLPDIDGKLEYTFLYTHISLSAFHSNVFITLERLSVHGAGGRRRPAKE